MATTRWRLYFPHTYFASIGYRYAYGVCAVGVEMRASIGGANECVGGTASASSSNGPAASNGFVPYSGTTRWESDLYVGSGWIDGTHNFPQWLAYEFTAPVEIEEITMTGVLGTTSSAGSTKNPVKIVLQYSEDGGATWNTKYSWVDPTPWATDGSDTRVYNAANAVTFVDTLNLQVLSAVNYPAEEVQATNYQVTTTFRRMSQELQATSLQVVSLVRGRTYNPKLRAWGLTLDGHDLYVLRLAEGKTLIYDLSTEQCTWWSTGDYEFWRPTVGMNWLSAGTIPEEYGSNVLCLDDTYGHVWVLNPEQPYDDSPTDPDTPQRFQRVATAQMITRQREFLPIYEMYLTADFGEPMEDGDLVTLQYSDDRAHTFVSAGGQAVIAGQYNQEIAWRSLGIVQPPGRIFQLIDDGAFARVDGFDIPEATE